MNADQWIKMLQTMISLLQVLIWPFIVLFALLYLGKTLKNYLNELGKDKNVSEVSAEAGTSGVKLTIKRQVEAIAMLSRAVEQSNSSTSSKDAQISSSDKTQEIVNVVNKAATPMTIQQVAGAKVLWVDDRPENNFYERSALQALGIQFTISTSTEDALVKVSNNNYDAIISDMGRLSPNLPNEYDKRAGYTLLEELQKRGNTTPFIIYAGSNSVENKAETKRRGGFGTTNNPQELFQLVITAIQDS